MKHLSVGFPWLVEFCDLAQVMIIRKKKKNNNK
jgi:hypothetical protein